MTIQKVIINNKKSSYPRDKDIIKWADERGIYTDSTILHQAGKLEEEYEELLEAIDNREREEKKDALGDMYVVMVNIAHMSGLTMEECIEHAWNEIKDRRGHMERGKFVKEA